MCNLIDKENVIKQIDKQILDNDIQLKIIHKIFDIIELFNGKKINKRIETKIISELSNYNIYLEHKYGMYHIIIYGNDVKFENRMQILIGYDSIGGIVDLEQIKSYNTCFTHNEERNASLKKFKENIDKHIQVYDAYLELRDYTIKYFHSLDVYPLTDIFLVK